MKVNCEFKNFHIDLVGDVYTCVISSPIGLENYEITGQHLEDKSRRDVDWVWIRDTKIQGVPRGLTKWFPQMSKLSITNCGLEEVSSFDLRGLEQLSEISFSSNKLETLPRNLFADMMHLKIVSFEGNQLDESSLDALEPIRETLMRANFSNNWQLDKVFNRGSLEEMVERKIEVTDESFKNDVIESLAELWQTKRLSDITVVSGNSKFKAHKLVLSLQSKRFAETLSKNNFNQSELVISAAFSPDVVEDFLRYFYTGTVLVDSRTLPKLQRMSIEYKVPKLESFCEELSADDRLCKLNRVKTAEKRTIRPGPKVEKSSPGAYGKRRKLSGLITSSPLQLSTTGAEYISIYPQLATSNPSPSTSHNDQFNETQSSGSEEMSVDQFFAETCPNIEITKKKCPFDDCDFIGMKTISETKLHYIKRHVPNGNRLAKSFEKNARLSKQ